MLPNLSRLHPRPSREESESELLDVLSAFDALDLHACIGVRAGRTYEEARDERRTRAGERQQAEREREVMLRRQMMRDRLTPAEVDREAAKLRIQSVDTSGTRPKLLKIESTNPQHLRVLSVMCYTRGWDKIMNAVLTSPFQGGTAGRPNVHFREVMETEEDYEPSNRLKIFPLFMTPATKEKLRQYLLTPPKGGGLLSSKYALFEEFSDGDPIDKQLSFVMNDPSKYCVMGEIESLFAIRLPDRFVVSDSPEVPQVAENDVNRFFDMMDSNSDIPVGNPDDAYTAKKIVRSRLQELITLIKMPGRPISDQYQLARDIFDESVYSMIQTLLTCFYPIQEILNFECKANEDLGPNASGRYVRFRGQNAENGGNVMVRERLNSTTHSPSVAESFTKWKNAPSLHVLLLSKNCPVLDIRSFLGADQNPELVCFAGECEVLLKPNLQYQRLTFEDAMVYGAQNADYFVSSEIYDMTDEYGQRIPVFHWFVKPSQ